MLKTPAYAVQDARSPLAPFTIERREPGPNEVLIDILYCGVCHSDIHQARDEWGGSSFPMVPGHEIVGRVAKVGAQVGKFKVGDNVGVGCLRRLLPQLRATAASGEEQFCDFGMSGTYNSFERDPATTASTSRGRPTAATPRASPSTRPTCCGSRRRSRSTAPRRCCAPASPPGRRSSTSA